MSFANQALSAEYAVAERGRASSGRSTRCREEIDDEIARLKLATMGVAIDTAHRGAGASYLASWDEGTVRRLAPRMKAATSSPLATPRGSPADSSTARRPLLPVGGRPMRRAPDPSSCRAVEGLDEVYRGHELEVRRRLPRVGGRAVTADVRIVDDGTVDERVEARRDRRPRPRPIRERGDRRRPARASPGTTSSARASRRSRSSARASALPALGGLRRRRPRGDPPLLRVIELDDDEPA